MSLYHHHNYHHHQHHHHHHHPHHYHHRRHQHHLNSCYCIIAIAIIAIIVIIIMIISIIFTATDIDIIITIPYKCRITSITRTFSLSTLPSAANAFLACLDTKDNSPDCTSVKSVISNLRSSYASQISALGCSKT